jgi:transposase-like protein
VCDLLAGLRDRGCEVTRTLLVVIVGAKALRRAVLEMFDHPAIQRCQLLKLCNATDRLPGAVASIVAKQIKAPTATRPAGRQGQSWKPWRESWAAPIPVPQVAS